MAELVTLKGRKSYLLQIQSSGQHRDFSPKAAGHRSRTLDTKCLQKPVTICLELEGHINRVLGEPSRDGTQIIWVSWGSISEGRSRLGGLVLRKIPITLKKVSVCKQNSEGGVLSLKRITRNRGRTYCCKNKKVLTP